jgi:hypothetical protein
MPWKRRLLRALSVTTIVLLSGCNNHPANGPTVMRLPAGYSCLAENTQPGGYIGTAWAKHLFGARKLALARCRAVSRTPSACWVRSCRWVKGAPISKTGYFTCYAKNTHKFGVWLSTSHNAYDAEGRAIYRCKRFSGYPASCYFDHCWLW